MLTALAAVYLEAGRLTDAEDRATEAVDLLERASTRIHLAAARRTLSAIQSAAAG